MMFLASLKTAKKNTAIPGAFLNVLDAILVHLLITMGKKKNVPNHQAAMGTLW